MSNDKVFADGFHFKRSDKAPDFVVGNLSINLDAARATFKEHAEGGWLNLQIKQGRSGNYYVEVDTWKPGQPTQKPQQQAARMHEKPSPDLPEEFEDDIPF